MIKSVSGSRQGMRFGNAINIFVMALNIIVSVIIAFETIVRFVSFLKEWRPAKKRKMGFFKGDKE